LGALHRLIQPAHKLSHRQKTRRKPRNQWIIVVIPVKILEDRTTRGSTDDRHSENASAYKNVDYSSLKN
jgi:hypothetical protein